MDDVVKTDYMGKATLGYSEFLCKNADALNAQSPKPGDRAVVISEGKVYFCVETGTWLEWGRGEEPISYLIDATLDDFTEVDVDEEISFVYNSNTVNLVVGNQYKVTVDYDGKSYAASATAEYSEDLQIPIVMFSLSGSIPEAITPYGDIYTLYDGFRLNEGEPEFGPYSCLYFFYKDTSAVEEFKTKVSRITIEEVSE